LGFERKEKNQRKKCSAEYIQQDNKINLFEVPTTNSVRIEWFYANDQETTFLLIAHVFSWKLHITFAIADPEIELTVNVIVPGKDSIEKISTKKFKPWRSGASKYSAILFPPSRALLESYIMKCNFTDTTEPTLIGTRMPLYALLERKNVVETREEIVALRDVDSIQFSDIKQKSPLRSNTKENEFESHDDEEIYYTEDRSNHNTFSMSPFFKCSLPKHISKLDGEWFSYNKESKILHLVQFRKTEDDYSRCMCMPSICRCNPNIIWRSRADEILTWSRFDISLKESDPLKQKKRLKLPEKNVPWIFCLVELNFYVTKSNSKSESGWPFYVYNLSKIDTKSEEMIHEKVVNLKISQDLLSSDKKELILGNVLHKGPFIVLHFETENMVQFHDSKNHNLLYTWSLGCELDKRIRQKLAVIKVKAEWRVIFSTGWSHSSGLWMCGIDGKNKITLRRGRDAEMDFVGLCEDLFFFSKSRNTYISVYNIDDMLNNKIPDDF
jgi:hypothetical protein